MSKVTKVRLASASVAALACGLLSPAAIAQDSVQEQAPEALEESGNVIVVTATKREQTLQEIPVAVSVTSAETLERAQIQDISDLQSVVPSLRVTQLQSSSQTNFVIRGFGNGANAVGVEPSVGVFIDGVYRSRSASAISDLPNVQRVEVLRGPQSTLFGKNASAGVISVVTKPPEYDLTGSIEATYGNFDQFIVKGYVSVPLVEDTLAVSVSGSVNQRDGFITNLARSEDLNDRDRWSVRGQVLFEPTANASFRLIADYDTLDEICCGAPNIVNGPATGAIIAAGGQVNPANPFDREVFIDELLFNDISNYGVSLQGDIEFDPFTVTAIGAWRRNDLRSNVDVDFTSAPIFNGNVIDQEIETFTGELRLTSPGGNTIDWMVGAFYYDETVEQDQTLAWGPGARPFFNALLSGISPTFLSGLEAVFMLPNGTFFENGRGVVERADQSNQSLSLFGQVDLNLTDSLTITGGLNYTTDEKTASFAQLQNTNIFDTLPLGALSALQFFPQFLDFPNSVEDGRSDDDQITWTARIAYDVGDSVNVYASAATGFKATSWNLTRDSRPFVADQTALANAMLLQPNQTFGGRFAQPEDTQVFEIGVKGEFPGIVFNLALFHQSIENFQTNVFTGSGFQFANAEEQSTKGFEFDVTVEPTSGLKFSFAGTILDPVYDSFTNSAVGDLSGEKPAGIHEVSLSVGGSYDFALSDNIDGYIRMDYLHESDVRVAENVPANITREVNTVNASLGFETLGGLGLQIWGRNIFNDEYLLSAFPSPGQAGNFNGYPNAPRTYGVTVRKRF